MPIVRNEVASTGFNTELVLPYQLRLQDFQMAMQDVYDFFYDVNTNLTQRGLQRLDDLLRAAAMSGMISDMLTASLARHSRVLTENRHHNGHPDLIVQGVYSNNAVSSGSEGVEIKATRNKGGAVDMHGARDQTLCVFVYKVDTESEPALDRKPMTFTAVYCGEVTVGDFRHNARSELGTRTVTLHKEGLQRFRQNWVYRLP